MLLAEAAPTIQRLADAAEAYRAAVDDLLPLAVLLVPYWGPAHPFAAGLTGSAAGRELSEILAGCGVAAPTNADLKNRPHELIDSKRVDALKKYAAALRSDPAATQ